MLARTSTAASLTCQPPSGPACAPVEARRQANPSNDLPATSIPRHMIATVRNCQGLPTSELAELLDASPAEIDAIRALGPYSGGDLLEASALIARDLNSAVQL